MEHRLDTLFCKPEKKYYHLIVKNIREFYFIFIIITLLIFLPYIETNCYFFGWLLDKIVVTLHLVVMLYGSK